jgi:hypothetical protein
LAEPEAVERLTMNDRYFFGLLERMISGASHSHGVALGAASGDWSE